MIRRWLTYAAGFLVGPVVGGTLLSVFSYETAYVLYSLFFAAVLVGAVVLVIKRMGFFN